MPPPNKGFRRRQGACGQADYPSGTMSDRCVVLNMKSAFYGGYRVCPQGDTLYSYNTKSRGWLQCFLYLSCLRISPLWKWWGAKLSSNILLKAGAGCQWRCPRLIGINTSMKESHLPEVEEFHIRPKYKKLSRRRSVQLI